MNSILHYISLSFVPMGITLIIAMGTICIITGIHKKHLEDKNSSTIIVAGIYIIAIAGFLIMYLVISRGLQEQKNLLLYIPIFAYLIALIISGKIIYKKYFYKEN